VFGPAFAAGGLVALDGLLGTDELVPVPGGLFWGVVLLGVAGAVAARTPRPWIVGPLAALPGALLVAGANRGLDAAWVPVVMVAGTIGVGAAAADFDRRTARFGLGPLLFVLAVLGTYFTVPDTENMRALVGVAVPLVLLAWPYAAAGLGAGGAYAAVGLLLWVVPIEAIGRPGAVIGALGTFGLLLTEPAGRALAPYLQRRYPIVRTTLTRPRAVVSIAQLVLVIYASRVAGMAHDASVAAILLVPALVAGLAFGVLVNLPEHRRRRHRRRRNGTRAQAPPVPAPPPVRPTAPRPNGSSNGRSNGDRGGHG
jgi:hypothetical protein